jgi:hypothetical protein
VSGFCSSFLIGKIGHDGEEDGFHTQEIIQALDNHYHFVMIERRPHKQNPETGEVKPCSFSTWTAEQRFVRQLLRGEGVLLGVNQNLKPHAVAWKNQKAHDPATQTTFDLFTEESLVSSLPKLRDGLFIPNRFLRMEPT